jgi:hypothetical protein
MKGCLVAIGILAGLVIAVIAFFRFSFYDIHVRYRLTVEVQDGDQVKTGSSVIDVLYNMEPDWSPSGPHTYDPRIVGYAPTVDLGERGLLFLTFDKTRTPLYTRERSKQTPCRFGVIGCLPFAAYSKSGIWDDSREMKARFSELLHQSGPRDVPIAMLPKLARFLNINDPLSLAPVSPDDLAASFGPGVELKRVTLQLTDGPLTPPPEIWPQWLKEKDRWRGTLRGYQND